MGNPYPLGKQTEHKKELWYDSEYNPVDKDGPEFNENTCDKATFYARLLTGKDNTYLSDGMMQTNRKGHGRMNIGSMSRAKVVRAITRCENLTDEDGGAVTVFDGRVYDRLPGWMVDKLLEFVNEVNRITDEEESE